MQVKDIMRARQREWRQKKKKSVKRASRCWVEITHNEQLEPGGLCHLSTPMHYSQASICMSSKTSLPIFLLLSNTYTRRKWTHTRARAHARTHTRRETCMVTRAHNSFDSRKLPSHSIWFVISFSALIISQYLGHGPLIVSRVLRSALLSHPDGWVLRPQSWAPGEKAAKDLELLTDRRDTDRSWAQDLSRN